MGQEGEPRIRKRASIRPAPVLDEMVLNALAASARPLSAYHIADRLEDRRGAAQVASVYRSLERLTQARRIERVETLSAFRLAEKADGILLVCAQCGQTSTLPLPMTRAEMATEAIASGFQPSRLVIEALGHCRPCREETIAR